MTRPTVLIVDDALLFQAGLAAAFDDEGFDVVARASDAMSAVSMAREHRPDLVMLDVLMPGMSGLEVLAKIIQSSPGSKVVLLTSSESEDDLLRAIKGGARGYVVKDTAMPALIQAVKDVLDGGAVLSPDMGGKLFDTVAHLLKHRETNHLRRPALTGRELEVLECVASGLTSRQIGEKLFISENTVKNHVRNILDKLGLKSRNEAVLYAIREDLISVG
ncbi:MAG: response regulator transcription factor [Acidimicrobiia bacterium]|nr:response regulator transcription factor [Acidimicrobiia bacterium]MDH5616886.1 response regulator transcription factor [Acidimicrobiia bacterium]